MWKRFPVVLLVLMALLHSACSRQPANNAPVRRFRIDGEVMRLDPDTRTAVIRHKDIDGWMKAMTMDYPFRDQTDYSKLHQGDHIAGTLFVQGDDYWVGEVTKAP